MGFNDLKNFDRLHRQVSAHLSYARTYFPNSQVCGYLNSIVAKSHNYYYIRKKGSPKSIIQFYRTDIPRIIAQNWRFIAVSLGFFLAASLFSYIFTMVDTKNAYTFLPQQMVEGLNIREGGAAQWDNAVMSSYIMSNNIYVTLQAFAYGISLGAGTAYILLMNGFLLGSLSALAVKQGASLLYWSLILPHGVIELSAIFIAGAAGLKIGYGIIRPGAYRRRDALVISVKEALKMMGIVVPMLVAAGIIEGFLTPSSLSPQFKLIFAAATGILLLAYFVPGAVKRSTESDT
jgi:uncharacterized membrane protein SpoIIM required for sporulation